MRTISRLALIPGIALALAGPVAAQTAATPSTVAIAPSVPTNTPPPDVGMTVTVTGCLELSHAPVVAGATAGVAGATTPSKYVLRNARAAGDEHGATPDAKVLMASVSIYNLYGNEGAMMTEVGHTVEIGGTVDRRDRLSQDVSEGPDGAPSAPKMAVMSIKTLGVACEK